MRQIHLVMPFMRRHLRDRLIEAYRSMNIHWHPIMFRDEAVDFSEPWIYPWIIPMDSKECIVKMPTCFKRNWFIKHAPIIDGDYYVTVDDDDMYEAGVFDTVKKMNADIVIISMKRGYHIPKNVPEIRRYPINTLVAHPDYIQIGWISAQQSFVKGRIFREHIFNEENHVWDGEMAIHHRDSLEQIFYRPDLFALFNYYEPERWDVEPYKISFGCMVNDYHRFNMCLKQSKLNGFKLNIIHNPDTACKGLNKLLSRMEGKADIGVLAHQDMYFKSLWVSQVREQVEILPDTWITAGVIGKDIQGGICGRLHDMRMPLCFNTAHIFPALASCFDECVIIVNLHKGFRFDENMPGFDLYGTQAVCKSWEMGGSAWIIDAFAEHYCMRSFEWTPGQEFETNFKWLHDRFPANAAPRIDTTVLGVPKEDTPARYDLEF